MVVVIRRVEDSGGGYYQVELRSQGGVGPGGGPFRRRDTLHPAAVYELQRSYNALLERMLTQAAAGVPVPPLDLQRLVDLSLVVGEILPKNVRRSLAHARLRAQDRRGELRITLQVDPASRPLLAVPWELLALPLTRASQATGEGEVVHFLLLHADTSLVRQVRGVGHHTPPQFAQPPRFLGLAATPSDADPIAVAPVRSALAEALGAGAVADGWYERDDTLAALQRLIRERNPQVLHLLCHGEQVETGRGLRNDLLFTHRDGYTQRVGAADLLPILSLASDLQLVVLHACHIGAASAAHPQGMERLAKARSVSESLSLALVRGGVPAVLAFQGLVRQEAAVEFVRACYASLAGGASVEAAVAAGRIGVNRAGGVIDWSQALLYQGSGWPEQPSWHTRLADGVMTMLTDTDTRRGWRAALLALALTLLAASLLRWALAPGFPVQAGPVLWSALICWAGLGVVGPTIIATATQSPAERDDLPQPVRHEARVARYVGAYLGYALGGLTWLGALAVLWIVGPLLLIPITLLPLFAFVAILASLLLSYGAARAQAQGAVIIAPVTPGLYRRGTLLVTVIAALIMLAAPFLVLWLVADLVGPGGAGLLLALALLTGVLRG